MTRCLAIFAAFLASISAFLHGLAPLTGNLPLSLQMRVPLRRSHTPPNFNTPHSRTPTTLHIFSPRSRPFRIERMGTASYVPDLTFESKLLLLLQDLRTQHAEQAVEFREVDRILANENIAKIERLGEVVQVKDEYARAFEATKSTTTTAPQNWCAPNQDPPRQVPHSASLEELFVQAQAAVVPFFRLLQAAEELVNAEQAHRQEARLKLKEEWRSLEKIEMDYGGDSCRLLDIVRGSITCRNFAEMDIIIQWLHTHTASHSANLIRVKSGFASEHAELTYGYRDVKLTVQVEGHLCELQLHLEPFFRIKHERGHKLYKWAREFAIEGISHPNQIMAQSPGVMAWMARLLVDRLLAREPDFFDGYEFEALQNILELQGKFEVARDLRSLSTTRSRALWPNSKILAADLDNLGRLLITLGEYEKARTCHEQAHTIDRELFGEEHSAVVTNQMLFAMVLSQMGKHAQAVPLCEQSLAIRRRVYGEEHPLVATALINLASLLSAQAKYDAALDYARKSFKIRKRLLGPQHPDTLTSIAWLGSLYNAKGDYAVAHPLIRQVVTDTSRILGSEHPDVASALHNHASLLCDMGKYKEARAPQEEAIATWIKALGEEHPQVATGLNNLAQLLSNMGKNDEALPLCEQSLAIMRKALGDEHPTVALVLNNLAMLLMETGRETEAKRLGEQALGIATRALGENHPTSQHLQRSWG